MKFISFFAVIICFTSNLIYSQNNLKDSLKYKIVYDFTYQENKEDTLKIKSEQMVLKVANSFSYYVSHNYMQLQEMLNSYKKTNEIPKMQYKPKSRLLYTIVKEYANHKMIITDRIGMDTYSYTSELINFDWKLHNEQKEIMGYQCKKATTQFAGREYIAWYSIEISISDGPYKFCGLPGLIFSIHDTKNHYRFEISSINKDNTYFSTEDGFMKPLVINREEYETLKKKYKEKPSSVMNNGSIIFPKELLELGDKRAKELSKYENNPLELTD